MKTEPTEAEIAAIKFLDDEGKPFSFDSMESSSDEELLELGFPVETANEWSDEAWASLRQLMRNPGSK